MTPSFIFDVAVMQHIREVNEERSEARQKKREWRENHI